MLDCSWAACSGVAMMVTFSSTVAEMMVLVGAEVGTNVGLVGRVVGAWVGPEVGFDVGMKEGL